MWTTSGLKLISKARKLQNKSLDDREWNIPPPENDGMIEDIVSGEFLGVRPKKDCSFGPKLSLQEKHESKFDCKPATDEQRWLRSKSDSKGYFTLQNVETRQLLTSVSKTKFKIAGKYHLT